MYRRTQTSSATRLRLVASNGSRLETHERQLHILDVENGVGSGLLNRTDVEALRSIYWGSVQPHADAQFIGATSSAPGLVQAALGWGLGPRWLHEDGPDGADRCLLEELDHPKTRDRFTHIFVLSGDHIFAEAVARLVASGVRVTVVSRPTALNFQLRRVASNVIYLPELSDYTNLKVA